MSKLRPNRTIRLPCPSVQNATASGDVGVPNGDSLVKAAYAGFALALSFASPLLAQSLPRVDSTAPNGVLPPHEVLTSVRSMGLEALTRPVLRGRAYVLRAHDANMLEKRVVVDARTGEVVQVRDVADVAPAYSPYDRRFGGYTPPRPPASIAHAGAPRDFEPVLDEPLFPRQGRGSASAPAQRSATAHAPAPKVRPASPAESGKDQQQAAPTQPASVAATTAAPSAAPAPDAAAAAASAAIPGKSIPAPVGSRVNTPVRADAQPAGEKTAIQMVPVAPLE